MLKLKNIIILLLLASLIIACREKENINNELNKPVNLQIARLGSSSIKLSWTDNSDNESGFRIYKNNKLIKETKANVESYSENGLEEKLYQFGVSSFNSKTESIRVSVSIDLRQNPKPEVKCKIFPDDNGKMNFSSLIRL